MSPYEINLVRDKRALGASWDACAAMINRPTQDTREQFERMDGRARAGRPAPPAILGERVRVGGEWVGIERLSPGALCVLQALSGGGLVKHGEFNRALARCYGRVAAPGTLAYLVLELRKILPSTLKIRSIHSRGYVIEGGTFGEYEAPLEFAE